jgi:hypothetical protein
MLTRPSDAAPLTGVKEISATRKAEEQKPIDFLFSSHILILCTFIRVLTSEIRSGKRRKLRSGIGDRICSRTGRKELHVPYTMKFELNGSRRILLQLSSSQSSPSII